jgi:hypothetical protein
MTDESKGWAKLRRDYLRQVEKALSSVRHPRARDVLDDVGAHLDRRLAELAPGQRDSEALRAIIADMGPPGDYATLLEAGDVGAASRVRTRSIAWLGAVGAALLVVGLFVGRGLLGSSEPSPRVYVVTFIPSGQFRPQTSRELLQAFNRDYPRGVRTHHYRPEIKDNALIGHICVDKEAGKDAIVAMLERKPDLELVKVVRATPKMLEELTKSKQSSLPSARESTSTPVYIVTFRPTGQFRPQTARELLGAFNRDYPRGARTHHYRTEIEGSALVGHICVDTEAGKDAIVAMLERKPELELVEAVRATPKMLEELQNKRQVSLPSAGASSSGSERTSRGGKEPTSRNRTVSRTGTWPAGKCTIYAHVWRRAMPTRVDHAKVRLSSDEFGAWIVEAEGNGSAEFRSIPAGTYRLCTVDTLGYRDSYYNPREVDEERPTFELKAGQRIQAGIEIKPSRPYRRITGRIVDEHGGALAESEGLLVSAWVLRPHGRWAGTYGVLSRSYVQADGSFALGELDSRPVYVQVRDAKPPTKERSFPPRFYPGTPSRDDATLVTFDEAAMAEGIDVAMQGGGGGALEGVVTSADGGGPVPRALVSLFHHDMWFDLFYTYADEQGRYRMEGLGAGTYIVHVDARHDGYVKTRKITTVDAGAAQEPLDFVLRRGGSISGTLVDEEGQPYKVGRGYGYASRTTRGSGGAASNFPYGNKHAPECIRTASTLFYEEGEGDAASARMAFPTETSFLLPAVPPGKVAISFRPRGRGERVAKMLHEGRDVLESGLTVEAGRDITGVTIVVRSPSQPSGSGG